MIDFGIDKLALIGAVALIVIGPEKLPRVARTVGAFVGKAQRYVSQVQSEVSRSIELEELKKMKGDIEDAARQVEETVASGMTQAESGLHTALSDANANHAAGFYNDLPYVSHSPPLRKNWRLKRGATPLWYKQHHGVRRQVQSGAARVARFRPPAASSARRQP
ncbi:MAG: Sec-independent protein translocase subunit TatB [Burkholderiales bacterium]|nr:Sec-independent protein translocase subunit TatB [Burkholderiales bacterium]